MATPEGRLSRLEGAYQHLATKADLQELKADLLKEMNSHFDKLLYAMLGGMLTIMLALILNIILD